MEFSGELYYIVPIKNIPSIIEHGILSYAKVVKVMHSSFAMTEVQDRRDTKSIPNGLMLHEYVNLYFHARNPAMYKRKEHAEKLCVLVISDNVLKLPNVVISDMNAASPIARFYSPEELEKLDFNRIYAMDWNKCHGGDEKEKAIHKKQKCAEVLVPEMVPFNQVQKVLVSSPGAAKTLVLQGVHKELISISRDTFFV